MNPAPEYTIIRTQLGDRIRMLRRAQGLSQAQLASMIQIDRTYLVAVEKGRRNVAVDNLYKIASGLGLTLSELFEGVDATSPSGCTEDRTYRICLLDHAD